LQEVGVNSDDIVYELNIASPTYGEYHGDGPIPVTGTVSPADAKLFIEGVLVEAADDGSFSLDVPFVKEYEIVEVTVPDGELRERIPVFAGQPAVDTWPGGMSARLLQPGMDIIGENLGAMVDEIGWAEQISLSLPTADWGWIGFTPVGVVNDPTVVAMTGAEDGLAVDFSLRGVGVQYELWYYDWNQQMVVEPMSLVFDEIAIGATAVPNMDENGVLIFSLTDADLTMGAPDVQIGQLQGWVLEWIMQQGFNWIVEPLSETLLTSILDGIGELEIGGPFEFSSDLMGAEVSINLDDVYGDPDGLALSIGMEFGELISSNGNSVVVPNAADAPDAQMAVGIHEGLFQTLLNDQLLGMLDQDLDFGGMIGGIIGASILNLPGGDQAPDALEGWCVEISPGTATAVRMQTGIEPLAYLYIPDLKFEVGMKSGPMCDTWLSASLAAEVGMVVRDGSKLGIDLEIAEGAILYYGADDVDEEEILPALSGLVQTMMGLLGGMAEFDLADMLGAGSSTGAGIPMSDLSIQILDSQPLHDASGETVDGLYSLSIDLWATE